MNCEICGELLDSKEVIAKIKSGKIRGLSSKHGLIKPLIYTSNEKSIIFYGRKRCYTCFEKKHNRKPKKTNIPTYDLLWFYPNADADLLKRIIHDRLAVTEKRMIKKYGDVEGKKRWKSYCEKQSETNTFNYKNKKYGMTKKEFDEYNKTRACTLSNFIDRHGKIEGKKRWKSYCEKQSYVGNKLDYFIEKYGKKEGVLKYKKVNASKANTLENFIKRYGENDGVKYYTKYINSKPDFYSNISQELFNSILENCKHYINKENIYFAKHIKEFGKMYLDKKTYYKYDFVISNLKFCIEYNGDIWHANPLIYNEDDTPNPFNKELTAKEIWKYDELKLNFLKQQDFEIFVVWEQDYLDNKEKMLYFILDKIKQRYEYYENLKD